MKIPSIKQADPIDAPTVAVDVVVTLEDQVRFNEHIRDQPKSRRRRRTFMAVMLVGGPPIGMLIGLLTSAPDPSLAEILRDGPAWWWLGPILISLLISAALAPVYWLLGSARRPWLKWQLRRLLAQRPGIDPLDPELREPCRCTFDEQGYSTQGKNTRTQVDWSVIRELEEVSGLMIVRTGPMTGFILPLRDMSDEQAQAIRAMVRDRLGGEHRVGA